MRKAQVPELNEKLIECVLDHIETHPDEYNQNIWGWVADQGCDGEMCGTQGCFAGWAVFLSTPVGEWKDQFGMGESSPYLIPERARKLLGLTILESNILFRYSDYPAKSTRNVAMMKQRLNVIRAGRGLPEVDYAERDRQKAAAATAHEE